MLSFPEIKVRLHLLRLYVYFETKKKLLSLLYTFNFVVNFSNELLIAEDKLLYFAA